MPMQSPYEFMQKILSGAQTTQIPMQASYQPPQSQLRPQLAPPTNDVAPMASALADEGDSSGMGGNGYMNGLASLLQPQQAPALDKKTLEEYQRKLSEGLANQQKGVAESQEMLKNYQDKPKQWDLSPLYALADQLTGGNSAKYYTPPETEDQRLLKQAQLQELVNKRQDEYNKVLSKVVTSGGRGGGSNSNAMARMAEGQQNRSVRLADNMMKQVNEKIMDKAEDHIQQFNQMEEAFNRGDYQSVMSNLAQYARAVSGEKGVLTDQDINRVVPRTIQGDTAKIKAYLSGDMPTAELPPNYTQGLREVIDIAKAKLADKARNELIRRENSFRRAPGYGNLMKTSFGTGVFKDSYERLDSLSPKKGQQSADINTPTAQGTAPQTSTPIVKDAAFEAFLSKKGMK